MKGSGTISTANTIGLMLANIFVEITKASTKMDSVAGKVFGALVEAKANTLDKFETLVAAAYAANNWQRGGGRPTEENEKVPGAVKTYVSELKAAYILKLPVLSYSSLEVLRRDVRIRRHKVAVAGVDGAKDPALAGVALSSDTKLNDAVFHDLCVVYLRLGKVQRSQMEQALQRVLKKAMAPVRNLLIPRKPPTPAQEAAVLH